MPKGRQLAITAGLLCVFAFGLWMGARLFAGPTAGSGRERLTAAADIAPKPIAAGVPDKSPVASESGQATGPAAAPPGGDSLPAVTPAGDDLRAAAAAPAGGLPSTAIIPAATDRNQRDSERTAATVMSVPRAPEAGASKSTVRARVAASSTPASPQFLGSLAIRSEPRGALVLVDGQVVGVTPIVLKGVRAGSRVVRIESEGYELWSSAARVVANQETAIVATLQQLARRVGDAPSRTRREAE
jgi:hypothetical protein